MKFKVLLTMLIICLAFSKLKRSRTRGGPSMLNPTPIDGGYIEEYVLCTMDDFGSLDKGMITFQDFVNAQQNISKSRKIIEDLVDPSEIPKVSIEINQGLVGQQQNNPEIPKSLKIIEGLKKIDEKDIYNILRSTKKGIDITHITPEVLEILGSQTICIYKLKNTKKERTIIKQFSEIESFVMEGVDSWKMKIRDFEEPISSTRKSKIVLYQNAFILYILRYYIYWLIYSKANEIKIPEYEDKKKLTFNQNVELLMKNNFFEISELAGLKKVVQLSETLKLKDMQCMPFLASSEIPQVFEPLQQFFGGKKHFNHEIFIIIKTDELKELFNESFNIEKKVRNVFKSFAERDSLETLYHLCINSNSPEDLKILKYILDYHDRPENLVNVLEVIENDKGLDIILNIIETLKNMNFLPKWQTFSSIKKTLDFITKANWKVFEMLGSVESDTIRFFKKYYDQFAMERQLRELSKFKMYVEEKLPNFKGPKRSGEPKWVSDLKTILELLPTFENLDLKEFMKTNLEIVILIAKNKNKSDENIFALKDYINSINEDLLKIVFEFHALRDYEESFFRTLIRLWGNFDSKFLNSLYISKGTVLNPFKDFILNFNQGDSANVGYFLFKNNYEFIVEERYSFIKSYFETKRDNKLIPQKLNIIFRNSYVSTEKIAEYEKFSANVEESKLSLFKNFLIGLNTHQVDCIRTHISMIKKKDLLKDEKTNPTNTTFKFDPPNMLLQDAKTLFEQYTKMDRKTFDFIVDVEYVNIKILRVVELSRNYQNYNYKELIELYQLVRHTFNVFVPKLTIRKEETY
jgi:hypothetical protein